jgi:GntR family transcriptional repressor for pyruvate dehydrogenase complex
MLIPLCSEKDAEVGMAIRTNGVHRMKVSDGIVEHITSLIKSGELKSGDKLPAEREYAVKLGVSRTALREAVRTLSIMNLLSVKQGEGTFVADIVPGSFMKPLSPMLSMGNMNILELIEVRRIIEPQAAALCARRATDEELAAILAIVSEMKPDYKSLRQFNNLDLEFHISVAKGSHNSVIVATLETIRDALYEQVEEVQNLPGAAERAVKFHTSVVQALIARDSRLAEKLMLNHIQDVERTAESHVTRK